MNIKHYKKAKWLSYEEIINMEPPLFHYLIIENRKRTSRFEKYVHNKITSLNPIDIEYLKEILLKRLFKLKTQYNNACHCVSSDRERKTAYCRNQIEKHVNKMNEFLQDKFGKPHFYFTEYYISNGNSNESGPHGLRQTILLEDFFKKI